MPAIHAPSPHLSLPPPRQTSPDRPSSYYHVLPPSSPYVDAGLLSRADGSIPLPSTLNYFSSPPIFTPWPAHALQLPPPSAPTQPIAHKVWILDCRTCSTFLTNRGMKAVLLLRPNVSLYSTDALPANCSAYSTNPDALRCPPCRPFGAPRTCECLTQTLCCHTCGTSIGYMIVVPCPRCMSVTANNRATNGHRFVFHSSEVIATVRHHIPNEPGVFSMDYHPQPPSSPPPLTPTHQRTRSPSYQPHDTGPEAMMMRDPRSLASSPSGSPDLSQLSDSSSSPLSPPSSPPSPPGTPPHPSMPAEPQARKLRAGDVLYWHQLSKTGEIPGMEEDPRARISNWSHRHRLFDR
ncbi:FAM72 protein-domain-containing protein [Pisolithus croceorrhizus]|nr:FAM72 protein-domain-containing protein [Pisolithus croceorrhizus]KAI6169389.1 FAM72 protein-domain-containing protein [Pisolithus thermaeus]